MLEPDYARREILRRAAPLASSSANPAPTSITRWPGASHTSSGWDSSVIHTWPDSQRTSSPRGEGIALARRSIVYEDLERGTLKRLFDIAVPSRERYRFVCPKEAAGMAKVRAFKDWVRAELEAMPKP